MQGTNSLNQEVKDAMYQFISIAKDITENMKKSDLSEKTRDDYFQLARFILDRRETTGMSVSEIISATKSKNTFYKRITALRRYFLEVGTSAMQSLVSDPTASAEHNIKLVARDIHELSLIMQSGFKKPKSRRNSKRKSLNGLPEQWMEILCRYGYKSKYATPLLVLALTGCRPAELQKGVMISYIKSADNESSLTFEIQGVKLSNSSGQTSRSISYLNLKNNSLITMLLDRLNFMQESGKHKVTVASSVNLTVEIRRIAKRLWPEHKHSITAYSFRHQFAANLKAQNFGDETSRALGHRSEKTRKHYGLAIQSRGGNDDISISASNLLKLELEEKNQGIDL